MVARHDPLNKITFGGLLVTLGIIYGDIGTSPLYVMNAIIGDRVISPELVLGGISCIFWTLTLQTTFKYVFLTLRADNKGEGGIFSLYALVRKTKVKWLVFAAILGGSALLADGLITPAISVSSAVEGIQILHPDLPTIPIIISIIFFLFFIQQFGSNFVGKSFGPIMLLWFSMLFILGFHQLMQNPSVLKAVNPYYAYQLLVNYPEGFWILGAVFLCTTGAEALYSDLGHVGRKNIYITWAMVKICLLINYFGQGANLLKFEGKTIDVNPFYQLMPEWFLLIGIIISTTAAVVASQALISGAFTVVNEAMRLNFGPKLKVVYPTDLRGQVYIPTVNWVLCVGCIGVILFFQHSSNMEGAYGLAIIINMMMTTILLSFYLYLKRYPLPLVMLTFLLFIVIEIAFLVANSIKFEHGGYVTMILAMFLFVTMYVWYAARKIRNQFVDFVKVRDFLEILTNLSKDESIPKYATNLVYLTSANRRDEIESKVMYSLLQKFPKRADIYWFVHVDVLDEPYTMEYKVEEMVNDKVIHIDFRLGFRIEPRINQMFRQVVEELVKNNEVDITSRYTSLKEKNVIGDFRFVVIEKTLSYDNKLTFYEKFVLNAYDFLKMLSLPESKAFGLDTSSVTVENVPLVVKPSGKFKLKRI
ncbi:MAG: KUP/HAK/KT family potassium transporter [Bacteroidia bacterium]|nr:KUP/HAK/KT family potassium transporter [Bacteroidia bacterium]HMW09712.1 KUP/HAK/KT family potassium transporter [Bacteroidia bacterium]HMX97534.1 KUP/HAK/KT family potassium transporter [Bacteroidia bacterium]HMY14487.1 KUP/HAK/KT family potassium transporter [Bacteroidia bacterium]HMY64860.1 KUP/HAK/KT family potassium transporter [Bacteroidia bacterium]